jgi:hypothetical protein
LEDLDECDIAVAAPPEIVEVHEAIDQLTAVDPKPLNWLSCAISWG